MYSDDDTLAGGFPHSDICGSKLVCQLPAAFRRLQRPSSPVIAKASTTCTYSLDPIGLRTRPTWTKSRIKHALFRRLSIPLESSLRLVRRNHIVVPATEQHVDYYLVFKEQNSSPLDALADTPAANRNLYLPEFKEMVEVNGIEPMTPCLQSRCSPS